MVRNQEVGFGEGYVDRDLKTWQFLVEGRAKGYHNVRREGQVWRTVPEGGEQAARAVPVLADLPLLRVLLTTGNPGLLGRDKCANPLSRSGWLSYTAAAHTYTERPFQLLPLALSTDDPMVF